MRMFSESEVFIEPWSGGKPGAGRVFAAVLPHSDDFTIFCGGLVVKLLREGYTGYFIRTTNDRCDSGNMTPGETVFRIEQDMKRLVGMLGIKKLYDFEYMNHYLHEGMITEIRHRLMTLIRFLKIDTVISFDPYGHYEENPDHHITARAVEQACWMAGSEKDLAELADMGIEPFHVRQKYYFARGPQLINRVIDISGVLEKKTEALLCNRTPMEKMAGSGDQAALRAYVDAHFINHQAPFMGLTHFEAYHHIGS